MMPVRTQATDNIWVSVVYYMEQLMHGAWLKACIATIAAIFTNIMFGDVEVLGVYMAFALLDLVLGMLRAVVYGDFEFRYLWRFARKLATFAVVVTVIGFLAYAFFRVSGVLIYAVNWTLFFCTVVEAGSIISNLKLLGCPIPAVVDLFLSVIRKQAARNLAKYVDHPEMQAAFEEALSSKDNTG